MSEVTDYLAKVTPAQKAEFERILKIAKRLVPDAEEGQSYGIPALRYKGKALMGFMAAKNHLTYCPFSPPVIAELSSKLDGYKYSKGIVQFTLENPLSDEIITDMINLRLSEIQP